MASEEAGTLLSSDSNHEKVHGVCEWGQVWQQGKKEGHAYLGRVRRSKMTARSKKMAARSRKVGPR